MNAWPCIQRLHAALNACLILTALVMPAHAQTTLPGSALKPNDLAKPVLEPQAHRVPAPTPIQAKPAPAPSPASKKTLSAEEQWQQGLKFRDGNSVTRDDAIAVNLFRQAAERGHANAQVALGWMYEYGRGVPQSDAEAANWYRKASEQGNADGQSNLGLMYSNGRGLPQSDAEAVNWFRKSADQGNSDGQGNLGWAYEYGRGVPQSDKEAMGWYEKAAKRGSEYAKSGLMRLQEKSRAANQMDYVARSRSRQQGQTCVGNADCAGTLLCKNSACVPYDSPPQRGYERLNRQEGQSCFTDAECVGDLRCKQGACALLDPHAAKNALPGRVFKDCPECPEMVVIPAGQFEMGSPENEPGRDNDEGPVHTVTVSTFALAKTEVTQGQWRAIMGNNPSEFKNCGDDCPVENVSWHDAQAFIRKLNKKTGQRYRLPSEAEWEYACRAGGRHTYCGSNNLDTVAWYGAYSGGNSGGATNRVAQKQANAFGLFDMSGNVWEWTEDCAQESYRGAPTDGSAWTKGSCKWRVLRGGSLVSVPRFARSAFRVRNTPSFRYGSLGFRPARILSP